MLRLTLRIGLIASLLGMNSGCAILYTSANRIEAAEVANVEVPEDRLIEVAIREFDTGISDPNEDDDWAAKPEIRNGEARFMPFQLKQTLQDSGFWGSVWVTPSGSEAAGLEVQGKIGNSDGRYVRLEIRATDVTGRVWLDDTYRVSLEAEAYTEGTGDPYQPIFSQIANDLLQARRKLSDEELREIRLVSELRFAEDLAPDAFKGYVVENRGRYTVQRLPARNDPLLERVRDLRDREFLFLDTMNDHYAAFYRDMESPYRNWRQLSRDEAEALSQVRRNAALRALGGAALIAAALLAGSPDSTAEALLEQAILTGGVVVGASAYGKYQESKMHEAALDELSASFGSEVDPLVVQVDGQTVRLTGSAAEQYEKWRTLLRELYATETGMIDIYAEPLKEIPASADPADGARSGAGTSQTPLAIERSQRTGAPASASQQTPESDLDAPAGSSDGESASTHP